MATGIDTKSVIACKNFDDLATFQVGDLIWDYNLWNTKYLILGVAFVDKDRCSLEVLRLTDFTKLSFTWTRRGVFSWDQLRRLPLLPLESS